MKYLFWLLYFGFVFQMCKPAEAPVYLDVPTLNVPPTFQKVLDYHGYDNWAEAKGLEFTVVKSSGNETNIVNLINRNTIVEADSFSIVKNEEGYFVHPNLSAYEGNPLFYHNIYFYFVAMPFVLTDPGIKYETLGDYDLRDTTYHALQISYNDGVGDAPKDEYILLSDKQTHEVRYLLYTVTYFSNEKSQRWSAKRYDGWQDVKGVKLPSIMDSYKMEDGVLGDLRGRVTVKDINIEFEDFPVSTYATKGAFEQWFPKEKS